MQLLPLLILLPFAVACVIACVRDDRVRGWIVCAGAAVIMLLTGVVLVSWIANGCSAVQLYVQTEIVDIVMILGELFLMGLVIWACCRHRKYPIMLLSIIQTLAAIWAELFGPETAETSHVLLDRLSVMMCVVIAVIGGLICIYAVGYMRGYHHHHPEFQDRRSFILSMLFAFLGAMFGLVVSSSLSWLYFFWEITSVISFLLIGYTKTEEAVNNSFRALWMNLLGGCGFAAAIVWCCYVGGSTRLQTIVEVGSVVPVACMAFAALTKSAQLPFSGWLLGAMVAPTPSSALLHSATMVKAGVYLLLRLAPAMAGTLTGTMVTVIGGFTFFAASLMAIAQNDAKKVLAFSTISNLGLITACAGVGSEETVWAAVLLLLFHAISKSMLFQSVGAVENTLGSRDIEDMHGLALRLPKLAFVMALGIAGMFLAPFGMLISKWVALKAFVDTQNLLLVLFVAFGSASTMFYWTKWLCKLLTVHETTLEVTDVTEKTEYGSLFVHAGLMIALCALFPLLSLRVVQPMMMELFESSTPILSTSELLAMVIMLASIVILPSIIHLFTRSMNQENVLSYMAGINEGDNRFFTDSFGEPKHLYLSNWYLRFQFGQRKLMKPSLILSAAWVIVLMVVIVGGAL